MLQLDPPSFTSGKKPHGFPVYEPHFDQVKRDFCDFAFGLEQVP
jgi:hypothetical protein